MAVKIMDLKIESKVRITVDDLKNFVVEQLSMRDVHLTVDRVEFEYPASFGREDDPQAVIFHLK